MPTELRSDADYVHDASYAANVQGGDHTSTISDGYKDMTEAIFTDSAVVCDFCGTPDEVKFGFVKAITGWPMTVESWRKETGPRIVTLQRAFLLMGGPDMKWEPVKDDDNPPRFYEPLPSGPYKGQTTNKRRTKEKLDIYFETLGWDDRGSPYKRDP